MRIEKDSFGEVTFEDSVLYGIQTYRTGPHMSFSAKQLAAYPSYIRSLAEVKKAAAIANNKAGIINHETLIAICHACDILISGQFHDQFPVDVFHGGGSIGINMNINEVISSISNIPFDVINASQSTADVCHSAIRITLMRETDNLVKELQLIEKAAIRIGDRFVNIQTISRTCLQDALPTPLSTLFYTFADQIKKRRGQIEMAASLLLNINLGGTVIGSGRGATASYRENAVAILSEVCDLPLTQRKNLYVAAQYPDDLADLSSSLRILSVTLIKFSKDLRLLSSGPDAGFFEISLPSIQAGSSFFPGKVNPVMPEMMVQCGLLVNGNDHAIQSVFDHGELYLNIWEGMAGILLYDNLNMLTKALQLFRTHCFEGIQANKAVCQKYSTSSIPFIMELKEKYGYEQAGNWMNLYSIEELKQMHEKGEIV